MHKGRKNFFIPLLFNPTISFFFTVLTCTTYTMLELDTCIVTGCVGPTFPVSQLLSDTEQCWETFNYKNEHKPRY